MRNALFVALFILAAAAAASAQNRIIYFPQIADGNEGGGFFWKTTIFLTNAAPAGSPPVSGSIAFVGDNGTPMPISFVDESGQPAGSTVGFQIAGTQTKKFISTSAGPLGVGLAAVTSNGDVSGVAVFSRYGPGERVLSEASVLAVSTPALRQAVIVDTTPGFNTGIALAHTGLSALPVTLNLINVNGVSVATTTTNQDSPVYHISKFVSDFFVNPPKVVGTLQISSTAPIAVVGLRFADSGAFTTVPTVTLASLVQPALLWFQQKPWMPAFSSVAKIFAGLQHWRA